MKDPRQTRRGRIAQEKGRQTTVDEGVRKKAAEESGVKWKGSAEFRRDLEQKINDNVIQGFLELSAGEREATIEQLRDGTLIARIKAGTLSDEQKEIIRRVHAFAQMVERRRARKLHIDEY